MNIEKCRSARATNHSLLNCTRKLWTIKSSACRQLPNTVYNREKSSWTILWDIQELLEQTILQAKGTCTVRGPRPACLSKRIQTQITKKFKFKSKKKKCNIFHNYCEKYIHTLSKCASFIFILLSHSVNCYWWSL